LTHPLDSRRPDITAARRFFAAAIDAHGEPEVITDRAAALTNVIVELLPDTVHNTEQNANNRIECDHGRLKTRLRPMRGLKTDRTASVIIRGHAFIQNLRRGHYELGAEAQPDRLRVAARSTNSQRASDSCADRAPRRHALEQRNSALSRLLGWATFLIMAAAVALFATGSPGA
jgi:IS6 family transposase